ncbi:11623_t:CDS:1, partial [Gigaspora rosea]
MAKKKRIPDTDPTRIHQNLQKGVPIRRIYYFFGINNQRNQ